MWLSTESINTNILSTTDTLSESSTAIFFLASGVMARDFWIMITADCAFNDEQRLLQGENEQATVHWPKRQEDLREAEWQTSLKLFEHAASILENPRVRCTLLDALRALELASILGRRATGLPLAPEEERPPKLLPWQQVSEEEISMRIRKIYGPASEVDGTEQSNSESQRPSLHSSNTIAQCQNSENTNSQHN
jgi:hypothetical protein